jgi:hypothetical protein
MVGMVNRPESRESPLTNILQPRNVNGGTANATLGVSRKRASGVNLRCRGDPYLQLSDSDHDNGEPESKLNLGTD